MPAVTLTSEQDCSFAPGELLLVGATLSLHVDREKVFS